MSVWDHSLSVDLYCYPCLGTTRENTSYFKHTRILYSPLRLSLTLDPNWIPFLGCEPSLLTGQTLLVTLADLRSLLGGKSSATPKVAFITDKSKICFTLSSGNFYPEIYAHRSGNWRRWADCSFPRISKIIGSRLIVTKQNIPRKFQPVGSASTTEVIQFWMPEESGWWLPALRIALLGSWSSFIL